MYGCSVCYVMYELVHTGSCTRVVYFLFPCLSWSHSKARWIRWILKWNAFNWHCVSTAHEQEVMWKVESSCMRCHVTQAWGNGPETRTGSIRAGSLMALILCEGEDDVRSTSRGPQPVRMWVMVCVCVIVVASFKGWHSGASASISLCSITQTVLISSLLQIQWCSLRSAARQSIILHSKLQTLYPWIRDI